MKIEIKSRFDGSVIFALETASVKLCVEAAVKSRADLTGADLFRADLFRANLSSANLSGANLYGADLTGANLYGADLYGANLYGADLTGANLYGADLYGANLSSADLSGANLSGANLYSADLYGKKVAAMRVFTGLYAYQVWAVLFKDGTRCVRMGCLFKSLEEWDKIGIRMSNLTEFPNDGSAKCEERVRAFEFAKAAALALTDGK